MAKIGSYGINYKVTTSSASVRPQGFALLDRASSKLAGEFIYVQATTAVDQYGWVVVDKAGQAVMLTTTNATSANVVIGVAQVAFAASDYGWVWVGCGGGTGVGIKGKVAASYIALANLNTTATPGVADDASTTLIKFVVGLTTDSGSGSSIELEASSFITCN